MQGGRLVQGRLQHDSECNKKPIACRSGERQVRFYALPHSENGRRVWIGMRMCCLVSLLCFWWALFLQRHTHLM